MHVSSLSIMFKVILMAAILAGVSAVAQGQVTINFNGLSPNEVLASDGSTLPVGDVVRIGFFSNTANLGTDNSFSDLNSIFTPLGEGLANSGTLSETNNPGQTIIINDVQNVPGQFAGGFNGVDSNYLPTGSLLYMWVFNSSVASSATEWGIYQAPAWFFPGNFNTKTVTLGSPNISVIRGSTSGSNFELANVATVPEPSVLAVAVSGMAASSIFLRQKRRDAARLSEAGA